MVDYVNGKPLQEIKSALITQFIIHLPKAKL